jgi:hypothetical protein
MVYIESAYLGDEKSRRNVTNVLNNKVEGTSLNVDVNEKLIPPFETVDKTELSLEDERRIKDNAKKACGDGVDQSCMKATEARLRQSALTDKEAKSNSSANVIQGRRLTVNIVDDKGIPRQVVVPDGQKFSLNNVSSGRPGDTLPSLSALQQQAVIWVGIAVGTAVYVFSVAATYTIFFPMLDMFAIPLILIALFVPYSGFIMILGYYGIQGAMKTYLGQQ